jgi:hypothetical protein
MHEGAPQFQPVDAIAFRTGDPFVSELLLEGRGGNRGSALPVASQIARELGYRFVVLQKDELPRGDTLGTRARRKQVEAALAELLGEPAWNDDRTAIWAPWDDPLPCADDPPPPDDHPGEALRDRRVQELGSWP